MAHTLRIGAAAGLLASVSMTITPAYAADMPQGSAVPGDQGSAIFADFKPAAPGDSAAEAGEYYRWGRWGRGRGWRGRRGGVRAGDVLAGVLVIGGIAAIASAASNNNNRRDRRERERERDREWQDDRRRDYQQDREIDELREQNRQQLRELQQLRSQGVEVETYRGSSATERTAPPAAPIGIDGAIDACTQVASRDAPVSDINGVERTSNGWSVRGTVSSSEPFTCRVSNDGRIEALDYRDGFRSGQYGGDYRGTDQAPLNSAAPNRAQGQLNGGQLSDNRYANARVALAQRNDVREPLDARYSGSQAGQFQSQAQPAYPGGPIPGETIPETLERDWRN